MKEIKFEFIYEGMPYSVENRKRPIVKKKYTLEQLIALHISKLCDVHDFMELVIKRQYTGLKDKDGVEIYEGDIIRYVNKGKIETLTREVKFKDGCFIVEEGENCDHVIAGICSDENHEGSHVGFVIGNIYETPELLK